MKDCTARLNECGVLLLRDTRRQLKAYLTHTINCGSSRWISWCVNLFREIWHHLIDPGIDAWLARLGLELEMRNLECTRQPASPSTALPCVPHRVILSAFVLMLGFNAAVPLSYILKAKSNVDLNSSGLQLTLPFMHELFCLFIHFWVPTILRIRSDSCCQKYFPLWNINPRLQAALFLFRPKRRIRFCNAAFAREGVRGDNNYLC